MDGEAYARINHEPGSDEFRAAARAFDAGAGKADDLILHAESILRPYQDPERALGILHGKLRTWLKKRGHL